MKLVKVGNLDSDGDFKSGILVPKNVEHRFQTKVITIRKNSVLKMF